MSIQQYRWAIELYRDDGTCIGQSPVSVDWDPPLQWVWFQGIRRGQLQLTDSTDTSAIRPVWHEAGEPYISAAKITILSGEGDGASEDLPTRYFKSAADAAIAQLVEDGRVKNGETVRYVTLAFYNEAHAGAGPKKGFKTREAPPDIDIGEADLAGLTNRSTPHGQADPDDFPVVIPNSILDETRELTKQHDPEETGGILIGHLRRDGPEVFAEVTAQIPAVHTLSKCSSLTFTHDTWTAAQAAVDLRREKEIFLGWWHSHTSALCKDCPEEKKKVCPLARGFLSADDLHLHRTAFSRAYNLALVATNTSGQGDVTHALFGWRRGLLESRGFYVLDDAKTNQSVIERREER